MQAGHSSRTGGFRDADGNHVKEDRPNTLSAIGEIVEDKTPKALVQALYSFNTNTASDHTPSPYSAFFSDHLNGCSKPISTTRLMAKSARSISIPSLPGRMARLIT